jgi:stearoyl-CoA desaturase (delta-9 desaturase)
MTALYLTFPRGRKIPMLRALPFVAVHLAALSVFAIRFHWTYLLLALVMYGVGMFFVTAGYHRYFSHRSFKTSRWFQFVLAFMAQSSAQKGILWWAANHRAHHQYSDTEKDRHSPTWDGFWWSHVGWILSDVHELTDVARIRDFAKYPELRWLNKHFLIPPVTLATALFLIGGWPWLFYGFFVATVFLWHGTFCVNSLTHVFGRQRYKTTDTSRNSFLVALITLGEGWHNNHHHYMSSTRQGFFWWEVDFTYYGLKVLSWFRLVWDLREPPRELLASGPAGNI